MDGKGMAFGRGKCAYLWSANGIAIRRQSIRGPAIQAITGRRALACYLLGVRATTFNGRSTRNDRNILKSKFSWPSTALFSRLREDDDRGAGSRNPTGAYADEHFRRSKELPMCAVCTDVGSLK